MLILTKYTHLPTFHTYLHSNLKIPIYVKNILILYGERQIINFFFSSEDGIRRCAKLVKFCFYFPINNHNFYLWGLFFFPNFSKKKIFCNVSKHTTVKEFQKTLQSILSRYEYEFLRH